MLHGFVAHFPKAALLAAQTWSTLRGRLNDLHNEEIKANSGSGIFAACQHPSGRLCAQGQLTGGFSPGEAGFAKIDPTDSALGGFSFRSITEITITEGWPRCDGVNAFFVSLQTRPDSTRGRCDLAGPATDQVLTIRQRAGGDIIICRLALTRVARAHVEIGLPEAAGAVDVERAELCEER